MCVTDMYHCYCVIFMKKDNRSGIVYQANYLWHYVMFVFNHSNVIASDKTCSYPHAALSEISNRIVGKSYYAPFDMTHNFSSDGVFADIVVRSMG